MKCWRPGVISRETALNILKLGDLGLYTARARNYEALGDLGSLLSRAFGRPREVEMKMNFRRLTQKRIWHRFCRWINPTESLWLSHEFPPEFIKVIKSILRSVTKSSAIVTYRRGYHAAIVIIARRTLIHNRRA